MAIYLHGTTTAGLKAILEGDGKIDGPWTVSDNDRLTYLWDQQALLDDTECETESQTIQRAFESAQAQAGIFGKDTQLYVLALEFPQEEVEVDSSCEGMEDYARTVHETDIAVNRIVSIWSSPFHAWKAPFIVAGLIGNPNFNQGHVSESILEPANKIAGKKLYLDSEELAEFEFEEVSIAQAARDAGVFPRTDIELPWSDCKVAFSIDDEDALEDTSTSTSARNHKMTITDAQVWYVANIHPEQVTDAEARVDYDARVVSEDDRAFWRNAAHALGRIADPTNDGAIEERMLLATRFFNELQESVETLTGIADQHGARTLADLLYLQAAILSGDFIDAWSEDSAVKQVVAGLPSAHTWLQYIRDEGINHSKRGRIWMAGPSEDVSKDGYTLGPDPVLGRIAGRVTDGDAIVCKNAATGEILSVQTFTNVNRFQDVQPGQYPWPGTTKPATASEPGV